MQHLLRNTLCAVLTVAATGCAGLQSEIQSDTNAIKASAVAPAPDAGFIENPERQTRRADLPFQKVWVKPGFDPALYRALSIAPVNTQYMQDMGWLKNLNSATWVRDVNADIAELAQYFHDRVVADFRNDPQQRFQIIEPTAPLNQPSLSLELALIEVNPSQPVLHALSWAGPLGTGTAAGLADQRSAAFEGRLRDRQTGEVVATFADRDVQDAGPLDLTRLSWYGPTRGIMDRWAEQFVQIVNRQPGEAVTDPTPFTLRPF